MKSIKLVLLTFFYSFIILNAISTDKKKKNQLKGPAVVTTSTKTSPKEPEKVAKPDVGEIWNDLFTVPRTSTCRAEINKIDVLAEVRAEEQRKFGSGDIVINESAFGWVRRWGFGPVAYLIDFFDSLFMDEIVKEFKEIHKAVMHESPENLPEYSDVFDFAGRIATAPPEQQDALMRDLKKFEKTYDPVVFQLSANSVQIYKAMKEFKWFIDPGMADYASDFVSRFDMNHDGRLNPKELILGSIIYNKGILGSKKCNNCYTKIARRIGALFSYLDCGETGFITADQLWKGLPELRRPKAQCNIFGYGNSENIRTNAINDFILKNQKAKEAYISKDEFVSGILLGYWDRQCTENAILDNDSRSLKKLRWSNNLMVDTAAYNYVKAITKARIEDEEKERYAKWERARLKKAKKAKELWNQQQAMLGN